MDWRRLRQVGFLTLALVLAGAVLVMMMIPSLDLRGALVVIQTSRVTTLTFVNAMRSSSIAPLAWLVASITCSVAMKSSPHATHT